MIHHLSFAANDPHRAAEVVAELWQGRSMPFPYYPGSYIALSLDRYGTAIEFWPKGTVLKPSSSSESVRFSNSETAGYTASTATRKSKVKSQKSKLLSGKVMTVF